MQWAYAKAGIQIPRTSEQQILASNGKPVDRRHLIPGDLVFFRDSGGDVHHVGISLGGDKFINAPHTGDVVKVASLDESYYAEQFAGGRRFDMAGQNKAQWVAETAGEGRDPRPASTRTPSRRPRPRSLATPPRRSGRGRSYSRRSRRRSCTRKT